MKRITVAALLALMLSACGGTKADEPKADPSETVAKKTLAQACPEMEAHMPSGEVPANDEWLAYDDYLGSLFKASDTEAGNAIDVLQQAVQALASAEPGTSLLDARAKLYAALDTVAKRCATAGSSAFS